jgi:hypothetical protein
MTGAQDHGSWVSEDTASMNGANDPARWQVTFSFRDGSSTGGIAPAFANDVPKMRLDNMGQHIADYLQLPAGSVAG